MGKSLIITEKPSVAQDFAHTLGVSGRNNGYIENGEYVITWCVGHLVEMVYPEKYDEKYKKWKLEDLPFLPADYKYDVIENVRKQYDIVHGLLFREDIDTVYWAGDAGKEGQTIEENIRNFGGVREGMIEKRVWIDSQTDEEIRRGIAEAKPMSAYANLGMSGIMRSIEDYAMGINFSRAMSVKYGNLLNNAAGTEKYVPIAIGRVMTCVLGMVVIREREIRNFVDTPFFRVVGSFSEDTVEAEWKSIEGSKYYESPLLYKENGFRRRESAQQLIDEVVGREAVVESINKGISRKKAPLLFNLAELQAECSKRFKISPDETLQVAQDLYEKKLTTYPRTDARVLSTAIAKEISKNISRLKNYEAVAPYVERIMKEGLYRGIEKTGYTDDSKVTDHYAVIPTGQLSELNNLSELQRKVFELITRRFLSIFYPPAEFVTVKLTVAIDKERFFSGAKKLKNPGYFEVAGKMLEEKENTGDEELISPGLMTLADKIKKGDILSVNRFDIREGKTSPPKRYTSGSMVLAMENAGQLIEDEELRAQIKGSGIGTSATRAEIIKKLVRIGYLNLNKKTQILTPENLGEMIFETVHMTVPTLLNPQMTASWEKGLDGITRGTVDFASYRQKLEDFIRRETIAIAGSELTSQIASQIHPFVGAKGKGIAMRHSLDVPCPICGKKNAEGADTDGNTNDIGGIIETTPFGYGCNQYKKDGTGCTFSIGKIAGLDLDEETVKELITTGKTKVISGFMSKNKKKFSASLVMQKDDNGKPSVNFDFSEVKAEVVPDIVCPVCSAPIEITPYGYSCQKHTGENPECYFSIGKIADKALSKDQIKALLTEGTTETIRGFKSKTGKKFDSVLKLDKDENGKTIIKFDFDHTEPAIIKDVTCPLCGGNIAKTSFGYGCTNYKKDDLESCRFSVGKMGGKVLTETQVKELLMWGRTSTIRGFKSRTDKKFDARIALNKDEAGKVIGLKYDFTDIEPLLVKGVKCPLCGGDIAKTSFGYGCINYDKDKPESCKFSIGKIASVSLKEADVKKLLTDKKTDVIEGFVAKTGMLFSAPLKLTEKGNVAFDFPEKPKPVLATIECPKCKKQMMKSQWYYECTCGFKVSHTVAKVELSEEIMKELFEKGRTQKPVDGFVSKAGNLFSCFLRFEDDSVKFDFENVPLPAQAEEEKTPPDQEEGRETTLAAQ